VIADSAAVRPWNLGHFLVASPWTKNSVTELESGFATQTNLSSGETAIGLELVAPEGLPERGCAKVQFRPELTLV
jgi:hypothetical protein